MSTSNAGITSHDLSARQLSAIRFGAGNLSGEMEVEGSTWFTGAGDLYHEDASDEIRTGVAHLDGEAEEQGVLSGIWDSQTSSTVST